MKKVIGVIGGLVLVAAVALAGVKTDKIVFGDDTEMTTAATGGSAAATNTTTVEFSQGLFVDGDVEGYDTYIGKDEATDYALRTTDGMYQAKLSGNTQGAWFEGSTYTVGIADGLNGAAVTVGDGTSTLSLGDGTYAIDVDGAFRLEGQFPSVVEMGLDDADDYPLKVTDYGNLLAGFCRAGAAGYFTDGTTSLFLSDGTYAYNASGPFYMTGTLPGSTIIMGVDDDDDYALKASIEGGPYAWLANASHAGYFDGGDEFVRLGATDEALRAEDDVLSKSVSLVDANYALNVNVGDAHFFGDEVKYMSDSAGTSVSWTQWAAGDTKDADGSWRMGVVNSNFVVQVRVSGAWTNATVFTRP